MLANALLLDESPLAVLPSLVKRLDGRLEDAMVLQQLHYRTREAGCYVASYAEWEKEMRGAIGERAVRRALTRLRELDLVVVEPGPRGDRRNRYHVNRGAVDALRAAPGQSGQQDVPDAAPRRGRVGPSRPGQRGQMSKDPERENGKKNSKSAPAHDRLPDDFPDRLLPKLEAVWPIVVDVAGEKGSAAPTRRGLARVLTSFPRRDHVERAENWRHWALDGSGVNQPIRDAVASYRNQLERAVDVLRPSDQPAGAPPTRGRFSRFDEVMER